MKKRIPVYKNQPMRDRRCPAALTNCQARLFATRRRSLRRITAAK
jgi:hypothetical protein